MFWTLGLTPRVPWDLSPNLFGVPVLLSLSFFGGLWGILMYYSLKGTGRFWTSHILYGAIFPTTVALLLVLPLKGMNVEVKMIPGGLILNGLWGLGTALFLKMSGLRPR